MTKNNPGWRIKLDNQKEIDKKNRDILELEENIQDD